jgi:membrane protein required for colicin V production
MNWLDAVFAVILIGSVASGIHRGFARIGVGLAASVVGLLFGAWFYDSAGEFVRPYVATRGIANFIGFFLVFLGIMIVGALLGHLLTKVFKWIGLSWFNRLMGGAIGLVRGVLISIVVLMAVMAFAPGSPPPAVVNSRLAPYLIESASLVSNITPSEMKQEFQESYQKVKKAWWDPIGRKLEPNR